MLLNKESLTNKSSSESACVLSKTAEINMPSHKNPQINDNLIAITRAARKPYYVLKESSVRFLLDSGKSWIGENAFLATLVVHRPKS